MSCYNFEATIPKLLDYFESSRDGVQCEVHRRCERHGPIRTPVIGGPTGSVQWHWVHVGVITDPWDACLMCWGSLMPDIWGITLYLWWLAKQGRLFALSTTLHQQPPRRIIIKSVERTQRRSHQGPEHPAPLDILGAREPEVFSNVDLASRISASSSLRPL
ncbi:hypothetical protein G7046_g8316 [Stylonectria norvegica]|nr:hypothetical protein G7046_g8316 [Stylonectria norvegica]